MESIRIFDDKLKSLNISFAIHYYQSSNGFERIKINEIQEVSDTNTTAYFKTTRYIQNGNDLYEKKGILFVDNFIKKIENENQQFKELATEKKSYSKAYSNLMNAIEKNYLNLIGLKMLLKEHNVKFNS